MWGAQNHTQQVRHQFSTLCCAKPLSPPAVHGAKHGANGEDEGANAKHHWVGGHGTHDGARAEGTKGSERSDAQAAGDGEEGLVQAITHVLRLYVRTCGPKCQSEFNTAAKGGGGG